MAAAAMETLWLGVAQKRYVNLIITLHNKFRTTPLSPKVALVFRKLPFSDVFL